MIGGAGREAAKQAINCAKLLFAKVKNWGASPTGSIALGSSFSTVWKQDNLNSNQQH